MKIESYILLDHDILGMLSKTKPSFFCVFINPKVEEIKNLSEAIESLDLNCDKGSLLAGDLLLELYDNQMEAENRVKNFRENWLNGFYVSCFKNGKYYCENT